MLEVRNHAPKQKLNYFLQRVVFQHKPRKRLLPLKPWKRQFRSSGLTVGKLSEKQQLSGEVIWRNIFQSLAKILAVASVTGGTCRMLKSVSQQREATFMQRRCEGCPTGLALLTREKGIRWSLE